MEKSSLKFILRMLVFLVILSTFLLASYLSYNAKVTFDDFDTEIAEVKRAVDGDTLELSTGEKVRLLGINTPEKEEYFYNEAKDFLTKLENQKIELQTKPDEKYDKYQRILAYVVFNNQLINEQILKNGLAHSYYYDKDSYTNKLLNAENYAIKNNIGIWQKSQDICSNCITLKKLNSQDPGEYVLFENTCDFNCNLNSWTIKDTATHTTKLNISINANQEYKIYFDGRIWNDAGDTLYLRDKTGLLVLFYRY